MSEDKAVRLTRRKMVVQKLLDDKEIDATVDIERDCRGYIETIVARFLSDNQDYNKVIEYPSDWWQAFKDRWFPDWLKRRYPVTMTVHEISAHTIYPHIKVAKPEQAVLKVFDSQWTAKHGFDDVSIWANKVLKVLDSQWTAKQPEQDYE